MNMKTLTKNEARMLKESFNYILVRIKSPLYRDAHIKLFNKILSDYQIKPKSKLKTWWRKLNNVSI